VLYRSAKQDPTRRFHALYDKLTRSDVMWQAWVNVATNHGAPGIDGVSIDSVEAGGTEGVRSFLGSLAAEVKAQSYRPQPLRRVNIPKAGKPGETRPLGIPTLRDRVLMSAAKLVLEPVFEADFSPASFGFRPKRSAHDALEVIRQSANAGAHWVLDADIKSCFDEIDQDALMVLIERRVCDRAMLKLLRSWLRAGIIEGGVYSEVSSGTPQGGLCAAAHNPPFGVAVAFAVDRLRDLVRRSFLARLCLASGVEPLWPFEGSTAVDAALADNEKRRQWREMWRSGLASITRLDRAVDAAPPGADPLRAHAEQREA
jgi:hypothetical protein